MNQFLAQHLAVDATIDGVRGRAGDDGLLQPLGHPLLLRARGRVHGLRQLPLLGDRPDRPEPADVDVGHDRSRREGTAARCVADATSLPSRSARHCSAGRRCPSGSSSAGELEGVHRTPAPGSSTTSCRTSSSTRRAPRSTTAAWRPPTRTDFMADLQAGRLPQVSWLLAARSRRASIPGSLNPIAGELGAREVVEAIVSQSEDLGEDRAVHHLRRERRVLRSRHPADAARRARGAST